MTRVRIGLNFFEVVLPTEESHDENNTLNKKSDNVYLLNKSPEFKEEVI